MVNYILPIISFLGVFQGFYLSFAFFVRRKHNYCNKWLAALFSLLSTVLLLIILLNSNLIQNMLFLEWLEFSLTFVAGPLLYLFSVQMLNRSLPAKPVILIHFLPFMLYTGYQVLFFFSISPVEIPIIIPLIHLQCYTIWLVSIIIKKRLFKKWRSGDRSTEWLVFIAALLVFLHAAQWVRYFFSEIQWLELIVPVTALAGIQVLILYGLSQSGVFTLAVRNDTNAVSESDLKQLARKLVRLIEEEKIYKDPDLTLEKLAARAELHPYKISQGINDVFGMGFNNFINRHRIKAVQKLLLNSQYEHFTIEALANEAGFNSRSSFYAAFRKFTGTTPTVFKKRRKACPE